MNVRELGGLMAESCAEVLDTMYFTSVFGISMDGSAAPLEESSTPLEAGDVAYSLRFTGEVSGDFGLSMNAATAAVLAENFLGDESDGQAIAEAIGELTNMLCGSLVSRIKTKGKFVLSHPCPVAALPVGGADGLLIAKLDTDSGVLTTWIAVAESVS